MSDKICEVFSAEIGSSVNAQRVRALSAAKHTDSRPKVACDECAERGECQVRHVQAHLYPADEALLAELQSDLGVSADEVVRLALHELAKRKRQD